MFGLAVPSAMTYYQQCGYSVHGLTEPAHECCTDMNKNSELKTANTCDINVSALQSTGGRENWKNILHWGITSSQGGINRTRGDWGRSLHI